MATILTDTEGRVINYRSFDALKVKHPVQVSIDLDNARSFFTYYFSPSELAIRRDDKHLLRSLVPDKYIEKVYMTEYHKVGNMHIYIFGYGK